MVSRPANALSYREIWLTADPDTWLVAVATSADRAAFKALYAHAAPRIKASLLRKTRNNVTLCDELTQEVMLRVWKRARTFDRSRGSAMGWIYTIARNARIDHQRRKRPQVNPHDPLLVDPGPGPDDVAAAKQRAERLRGAVKELPEAQAEVLEHAYFGGRTLREIAEATDTPLGTIKSRVRLAMARLRSDLDEVT